MTWQPIETAPKDGTTVLLWNGGFILGWWETGREFKNSPHFNDWSSGDAMPGSGYDCGFARVYNPTHWQPLPAPPPGDGEAPHTRRYNEGDE